MFWNHRIVELTEPGAAYNDRVLVFAEVFYNDRTKKPYAWIEPSICEASVKDMKKLAKRMLKACEQPVLKAGDMDPPVAAPEHLLPWIALTYWTNPSALITENVVDEAIETMRDI